MPASLAARANGCQTLNISRVFSTTVLRRSSHSKFVPITVQNAERTVKSPKTNLPSRSLGDHRLSGHVSPTSLLVQSNPSSLRRCKEENDIFRYFDDMQSIIRSRKIAKFDRKKRKRNLSYDLVGVELNPGPTKSKSKNNTRASKTKTVVKAKKVKTGQNPPKGGSDSMSKYATDYMLSVLQPCAGNSRIPDMNCIPTFLTTLTSEISLVANAQGVTGIYFYPSTLCQYQVESSTSTDALIATVAVASVAGAAQMISLAPFVRLVSACIDVVYTGNTQTDGGIICGSSFASFAGTSTEVVPSSLSGLQNSRSNTTLRAKDGISVFYRPSDAGSFDFRSTASANNFGGLVVHMSGLQASTSPFMVKLTANYECIVSNDNNSLNSSALRSSPVDVPGLGVALSNMGSYPAQTSRSTASSLTSAIRPILSGLVKHGPSIASTLRQAYTGSNALF